MSIPSQSAQGSTPRQLCCIGLSSSIAAGWTVSVSARWLQPNSANSEQAAITENTIFFTLLSLSSISPVRRRLHWRTFPRSALTEDFCALEARRRSFDARVGRVSRRLFCTAVNSLIRATSRAIAASRFISPAAVFLSLNDNHTVSRN